jgi:hypothetical protein
MVQTGSGALSFLSNGYRRLFPKGAKRPVREANQSPQSIAEVKNGGAMPPLPDTSSCHGAKLIKHRVNFIFSYFTGYHVDLLLLL